MRYSTKNQTEDKKQNVSLIYPPKKYTTKTWEYFFILAEPSQCPITSCKANFKIDGLSSSQVIENWSPNVDQKGNLSARPAGGDPNQELYVQLTCFVGNQEATQDVLLNYTPKRQLSPEQLIQGIFSPIEHPFLLITSNPQRKLPPGASLTASGNDDLYIDINTISTTSNQQTIEIRINSRYSGGTVTSCSLYLTNGNTCQGTPYSKASNLILNSGGNRFYFDLDTSVITSDIVCMVCDTVESEFFKIIVKSFCSNITPTTNPSDLDEAIAFSTAPQTVTKTQFDITNQITSSNCTLSLTCGVYAKAASGNCEDATTASSFLTLISQGSNLYTLSISVTQKQTINEYIYKCSSTTSIAFCSNLFKAQVRCKQNSFSALSQSFAALLQKQQNGVTSDTYTETKTVSQLFNMADSTCDFDSCDVKQSSGVVCPQASITKQTSPSTQTFTITRTTTNIQLTQQCQIECKPSGTTDIVTSPLFNVFVQYACDQTSSYTQTPVAAVTLDQNSQTSVTQNRYTYSFTISSMISYLTGYTCSILNCQLFSYSSGSCQSSLSETWILSQSSTSTQLNVDVDTSSPQSAKEFCVSCTNSQLQTIPLTQKITIGVKCNARIAITVSSQNTGHDSFWDDTGTNNIEVKSFDIKDYFTSEVGVCNYIQCSLVDFNNNPIPWLTGASLSGDTCSFNVDRSQLRSSQNFYLKLTSITASPTTVISNVLEFKVLDPCTKKSQFTKIDQSFITLLQKQMSGSVTDTYTETKTASQLFILPRSSCDFASCQMVTSEGTACPQADISKAAIPNTQSFIVTRLTTNIQISQECIIKCTLADFSQTVETDPFDVHVDYACEQPSSYIPMTATTKSLNPNSGTANQNLQQFSFTSIIAYQTGYTCSISNCKLYSYISNICQWSQTSLSESWITQNSDSSQINAVIDTSTFRAATEFCVACRNTQSQKIKLANRITIGVICYPQANKVIVSPHGSLTYIQQPTTTNSASSSLVNPTSVTLDIANYFSCHTGVCTYISCDIVDSLGNSLSWITGAPLSGNSCTLSVTTTSIQALQNIYLKLTSSTASPATSTSQAISIQVTDACQQSSFYTAVTQQFLSPLYQKQNTTNAPSDNYIETKTANQFFSLPLTTCDFNNCQMKDSQGNDCYQASLVKGSAQIFNVIRTTTNIKESQQCRIICTLSVGAQTVQTDLFDVTVLSQCYFSQLYSAKDINKMDIITYYQFTGTKNNLSTSLSAKDFINFPYYGNCNQFSCVIEDNQTFSVSWINFPQPDCSFIVDTTVAKPEKFLHVKLFFQGNPNFYNLSNQIYYSQSIWYILSNNFTAQIKRSCPDALITLKSTAVENIEDMKSDYITILKIPRLIISKQQNITVSYKANITTRFTSTFFDNCPLTSFKISKVLIKADGSLVNDKIWQNYFNLSTDGIFTLFNFNEAFSNYLLYVQAANSDNASGGDTDYLIDISVLNKPTIDFPPLFDTDPQSITLKINLNQNILGNLTYLLPQADNTTSLIGIESNNKFKYLTINLTHLIIDTTLLTQRDMGLQQVKIFLQNKYGTQKKYEITITFIEEQQPLENFVVVPKKSIIQDQPKIFVPKNEELAQQADNPKNLTCRITKISIFGDVELTFNDTLMIQSNFNLSFINETNTILSILVAQGRDQDPGFNSSKLMFTWSVVNITKNKVLIKLNFSEPSFISPLTIQDQLNLTFNGSQYFFQSSNTSLILHESSWTVLKEIKPQMTETKAMQTFLSSAESANTGFKFIFLFGLLLNILGQGEKQLMFGMIRALQLVLHLPMMQIILPPNVSSFFKTIIPIVMFDIISVFWKWEDHPNLLPADKIKEQENSANIYAALKDLGYETTNAFTNLTTVGLIILFYYFKVLIAGILKLWLKLTKERYGGKRFYKFLTKGMFFNEILGVSLEAHMEFLIGSYLSLKAIVTTYPRDQIALVMSIYMATISLAILPAVLLLVVGLKKEQLEKKSFKRRIKELYDDLELKCPLKRAYFLMYCIKRSLFVGLAFYFSREQFQGLQLVLLTTLNFMSIIYIGSAKAFQKRLYNYMDIFNESFTAIISCHMFLYSSWVEDKNFQTLIGWSMIAFTSIMIALNLLPIFYFMGKQIKFLIIKYFRIISQWLEKKLLGDSFPEAKSSLDFVQTEKERLKKIIENRKKEEGDEILIQLSKIIQHEANLVHAQQIKEEEREQRISDYENKRQKVIDDQTDFQNRFLKKAEELKGQNLLMNKIVEGIHTMNKEYSEQKQQEYVMQQLNEFVDLQKQVQNDIVNPLKIDGILDDNFMETMRIEVPQLYKSRNIDLQTARKKRKKYVKIHLDAKKILESLNMSVIPEEQCQDSYRNLNNQQEICASQENAKNEQQNSKKSKKKQKQKSLQETQLLSENQSNSSDQIIEASLQQQKKKAKIIKKNLQNQDNEQEKKGSEDPNIVCDNQNSSTSIFKKIKSKKIKPSKIRIENEEKREIRFEELPITFQEWEKADNLFRYKSSTSFKTFLQHHYKCLFDQDFTENDWTLQFQGESWEMEKKKLNIRSVIAQLRSLWIFDNDSEQTKLNKFKGLNNLMQKQSKLVKNQQKVPNEMIYNLALSALASQFQIPRKEFILKLVPIQ